jgi:proton glutamate symport protein
VLGAMAASANDPSIAKIIEGVGVVGTLWINAIRMTVIPLVAALTVTSVASIGDAKHVGRLGGRAVLVFLLLLLTSGAFAMLVAPMLLDSMTISSEAVARLSERFGGTATPVAQMPSLVQRIVDMVLTNPIKAAADTAMLPVVVFSLAFGIALSTIAATRRDAVLAACRAISEAMLVLVGWVLRLAPIGVFALALVLGLRFGAELAGVLVHYIATLSVVLLAFTIAMYPFAIIVGRVSPKLFATAALPAQAVAFSTRSSLAALPAMIAGARDVLKLPSSATGFVLPLAVSVFRLNVPIAWVVGVIFLGKLYGIPVTQGQIAMLVVTATLLSFSVPGIPSASLFLMAPVLAQNGIPPEGVGILIALDAIPDMFKTLANVTGHMTAATVVSRFEPAASGAADGS